MNRQPTTLILLSALVVLGAMAAFWLLQPDDSPRVNDTGHDKAATDTNRPDLLDLERDQDEGTRDATPPTPENSGTANGEGGEDSSGVEDQAPEPAEITETPIVPIYGTAVKRGGATATFELFDRNDQPLYEPDVEVTLWRAVGVRWIKAGAHWDATARRVVCDGDLNEGLEPGGYQVEIDAGLYGHIRHEFHVSKSQQLETVLRTPNYRRVIAFRFVHPDGTPVEWINRVPGVQTTVEKLEKIERLEGPGRVLRDPPKEGYLGGGVGGGGGRGGGGSFIVNYMVKTDEGRIYVPVIVGAQNTVTFRMKESIWGVDKLVYEGEFFESEWDDFQVELNLAENFEELTKNYRCYYESDPGLRSRLQWKDRIDWQPDPAEPARIPKDHNRVLIEAETPEGAELLYKVRGYGAWRGDVEQRAGFARGLWYVDAEKGKEVHFAFYRAGQRLGAIQVHTVGEERVQRVKYQPDVIEVKAPNWSISPTVDAWVVRSRLNARVEYINEKDKRVTWNYPVDLSRERYLLGRDFLEILGGADAFSYSWHVSGYRTVTFDPYRSSPSEPELIWELAASNSEVGIADAKSGLRDGTFRPGASKGVALRVIGPRGEGLPWAECSLVPYESDAVCRELREAERALEAEGKRPYLGGDYARAYYRDPERFGEEKITPEDMQEYVGEEFVKRIDGQRELAWYAGNGAWYDTRRKLGTDPAGYAIDLDMHLEPGELYVLYLWSNSRDDLQPDKRVVFKATEGVTDLGAIRLPTYID